jgi:hypothetical protein
MSYDLKVSNGDLVLNNGDFRLVKDGEKLIQDILKIALTPTGGDPLQPWYGSFISRTLIGSPLGTNIIMQVAQSQLQNALENLRGLQQAQIKSFQAVTPDEQLGAISDISIVRNTTNPTLFDVRIKVISKGFKSINTSFTVNP